MSKLVILLTIIHLLFNFSLSQTNNVKKICHNKDSIKFFVSYVDSTYKYNDTVKIEIRIENKSSFPIVIFDYDYIYSSKSFKIKTTDSSSTINEVYLFGDWKYEIGYDNYIYAKKIITNCDFAFTFDFILTSELHSLNYNNSIFSNKGTIHPILYTIFFNMGYFNGRYMKTIVIDSIEYLYIESDEDFVMPENYLQTILLGPIWIKQK